MDNSTNPIEFILELTDYFEKRLNDSKTNNPVFINAEIKAQLSRFIVTPTEAQRLLTLYKDTFPTDFFENVVKPLVDKLNDSDFVATVTEIRKADIRYFLTTIENNQAKSSNEYVQLKHNIETHGHFIVSTPNDSAKVYTPELAYIFCSNLLPVKHLETEEEIKINGSDYIKTFIEAYKEGEQYFETEFRVSPNTLYGANAEHYVRDIHQNYFHVQHAGINQGWHYVKTFYPLILTHKTIQEFGYYSGIVNKVEEQVKKYPRLFATFETCEHNLDNPPQKAETKTEQETHAFTNNFDRIKPIEIYKHFKAGLVEKGYLTELELNEYLKAAFELKTPPQTLFKIKDAPNKAAIEAVFYEYYKNIAGKIHGKQKQYAALLGDYFEGYKTATVSSNFSKSVY